MIPGTRPTRSRNTIGRGDSQNAKRTRGWVRALCEESCLNDDHGKNPVCQLGNLTKLY